MAIDTVKNQEIFIDGVTGFGFYRAQKLTKAILCNIIYRFFSKKIPTYKLAAPGIKRFTTGEEIEVGDDKTLLHILEDFPYNQRRVPCIVVSTKVSQEKKMYMGADNEIGRINRGSFGFKSYVGAATLSTTVIVVAESPDVRMELCSLIHLCFTHYHRWHYLFAGDDDSSFSIVPAQSVISFGNDFEVNEAEAKRLYCSNNTFTTFTDWTFTDNLDSSTGYRLLNADFEIDEDAGPIQAPIVGAI